jgi:hypothetical protein
MSGDGPSRHIAPPRTVDRQNGGPRFPATKQNLPGMKPFSGFHEGMVKPPAIRKGIVATCLDDERAGTSLYYQSYFPFFVC